MFFCEINWLYFACSRTLSPPLFRGRFKIKDYFRSHTSSQQSAFSIKALKCVTFYPIKLAQDIKVFNKNVKSG